MVPVSYETVLVAFEENTFSETALTTAFKLASHRHGDVRVLITLEVPNHLDLRADLDAEELPSYHRNVDNDESVFVHHDEGGPGKPGRLVHTPQGILHGADEAARAAFQKRRVPGMRRTICGVSVDADRPLVPSPTYERLTL